MNKATFDRAYKAIKGHMLERVRVLDRETGEVAEIKSVIWDEEAQCIFIVTE